MLRLLERVLDSPRVPYVAGLASLALGLFFVFVWAPHPWGWQGIDQYHDLALGLARGEPFATTDVPWGYAYYVAAFYAVFGERAWLPVTVQVVANATIPVMLFHLVHRFAARRIAALGSVLVGGLSFNTVYASTQASDSICTFLFVLSLLCLVRGYGRGSMAEMAVAGFISGLVPQFRPNMLLFPLLVAGLMVLFSRRRRRDAVLASVFLALTVAALSPWIVRNYRLTGMFLPTSTHGGVQLWYGTLQVGPYLESRAHNPRSIFETASFDYTSLAGQSIIVTAAQRLCEPPNETSAALSYRTDRDPTWRSVAPRERQGERVVFELPGQQAPTAVYYYVATEWTDPENGERRRLVEPRNGDVNPAVYFVADEHLTDLDRHGDLLDVFDLVRLMRHLAWKDPLANLRLDGDDHGGGTEGDLTRMVVALLGDGATPESALAPDALHVTDEAAMLRLADGSSLAVPRSGTGRVTDLDVRGALAGSLVSARRRLPLPPPRPPGPPPPPRVPIDDCRGASGIQVNEVFYRREPHMMQRYLALAFDNIERDPWRFAAASAYRFARLFVVRGTDDRQTTQQFEGSTLVYAAGLALSAVYVACFGIGVVIAWRQRSRLLLFLVPILYVPLTICVVLTNMRYTITVQPLMFAFVALALGSLLPRQPQGR